MVDAVQPQQNIAAQPIQAPLLTATFFQTFWTSNEISVLMANNTPALTPEGTLIPINQAVAILSLSPQSAKDFSLLLADAIQKFEAIYGPIETDYTRRRAAETNG